MSPKMSSCPQDRDNSPSSCAGLFIASHIGFDWPGVWVHLDIAAPVHAVSASGLLLKARQGALSLQTRCHFLLMAWATPSSSHPVPAKLLWLRAAAEFIRKVLCSVSDYLWPSLQPAVVLTPGLLIPGNRVAAVQSTAFA